jgi:diguanylate cyclase (GGDEF)-like protein
VAKPRGFTMLCQQIGHRIAEAAAAPLATALVHEQLHLALARASDEARRDPLTGVANRLGWQEALAALGGERRGTGAAIIMLDLDELKQVNDEHGHRAGDQMLRVVANALVSATRRRDTVARVGGDEFAVLLPNTDETSCLKVVRRIDDRIAALTPIGGRPVAASMGWASRPTNDRLDEVLQLADRRMYEAKRARTGR